MYIHGVHCYAIKKSLFFWKKNYITELIIKYDEFQNYTFEICIEIFNVEFWALFITMINGALLRILCFDYVLVNIYSNKDIFLVV